MRPSRFLSLLAAGMLASVSQAQSDRTVTTTREKPAIVGIPEDAQISDLPRYYLDTIDNLNRYTDDAIRPAPGLSKNNYVAKIYPVYNTEAIEIQSYLLRALAYEGGICEVMGADGVTDGDGREVQFLYVTAPDFMIPGITEMVEMSDRDGFKFYDATGMDFGGGSGAVQYVAKHRTASELVGILGGTELGNVGAFLFPPFADDSTNSIYIVENPTDIADDILALEMFDKPPLQVEMQVNIYEISNDNRSKLGVDYDAWKRFFSGSLTYTDIDPDGFFGGVNDMWTTVLQLDAASLTEFLNYTVTTGTTDLVTTTKLTMVNSEDIPGGLSGGNRGAATGDPAVVSTMTAVPYVRTVGTNGVRYEEVDTSAEEGILLEILPFIGTESMTLDIGVTVNSLVGFSGEENVPVISSRASSSVVNVANGQYLVLSGFKKTGTVETTTGLPLLKDIPVVKYLFSKEVSEKYDSEILVSLYPVIKQYDSEATAMLGM